MSVFNAVVSAISASGEIKAFNPLNQGADTFTTTLERQHEIVTLDQLTTPVDKISFNKLTFRGMIATDLTPPSDIFTKHS